MKWKKYLVGIAYLKGIKDFAELHITLKDDVDDIINKVEGKCEGV